MTIRIMAGLLAVVLTESLQTIILLAGAILLLPAKLVVVKMLPFDNKSEVQLVADLPEGTSLEVTARVLEQAAAHEFAGPCAPHRQPCEVAHEIDFAVRAIQRAQPQAQHVEEEWRQAKNLDGPAVENGVAGNAQSGQ